MFTLSQLSCKFFIVGYMNQNSNKTHTLQLVNGIVVVVAIYLLEKTESFVLQSFPHSRFCDLYLSRIISRVPLYIQLILTLKGQAIILYYPPEGITVILNCSISGKCFLVLKTEADFTYLNFS